MVYRGDLRKEDFNSLTARDKITFWVVTELLEGYSYPFENQTIDTSHDVLWKMALDKVIINQNEETAAYIISIKDNDKARFRFIRHLFWSTIYLSDRIRDQYFRDNNIQDES